MAKRKTAKRERIDTKVGGTRFVRRRPDGTFKESDLRWASQAKAPAHRHEPQYQGSFGSDPSNEHEMQRNAERADRQRADEHEIDADSVDQSDNGDRRFERLGRPTA